MAECQGPYPYTGKTTQALTQSLSAVRFASYLTLSGYDPVRAMANYLYNARLAKALLFPLHIAEVTLRNAIHEQFSRDFGAAWPWDTRLRTIIGERSVEAIEKALERLRRDQNFNPTADHVVATLTFDFWSNLLRPDYDRSLWQTRIRHILPNLPREEGRPDVQNIAKNANHLRNRIAHHEPIIRKLDLTNIHSDLLRLIGYRCIETKAWVKAHSTFTTELRKTPATKNKGEGSPLIEKCAKNIEVLPETMTILDAMQKILTSETAVGLIPQDDENYPYWLVKGDDILRWIADNQQSGYVALEDGTLAEVKPFAARNMAFLSMDASTDDALQLFYEPGKAKKDRPQAIIVMDDTIEPAAPIGIALRPHIKLN